ncbi:MAG: alpha-amylase/4-alpha-glucanotransferase domain-containing protein [Spirochaetota bacterium]
MDRVRLIFGSTNSQPVGATDDEIEHAYQRSYKPFLRALYNAPQIPVTLHYSGQLLQWLEKHHSEYTDVLSEMVSRKQIELLGGGFYDPVLSLIPRPDRLGQIESLTTYLRKRFGRRPRGTWITEHVWEPSLASTLKSSGMEYVFLDDYHFIAAGLTGDDLLRPCITEDQGKTVMVFPVCHDLKHVARDDAPEKVISFMRERASEDESRVFVLMDEGERYSESTEADNGPTPRNLRLERFVELIGENREWIEVVLPAQYLKENRPRTRGYFPSASYEEMMYWSLTPERQEAYEALRQRFTSGRNGYIFGGYFRQFLTKYSESNLMYAKMQYTHVLVNQIRGDKYRKQAAREELWKGQCHNAYWHGHHGGIYVNRLRKNVYRSLIEAEKKTREKGIFIPSVVTVDFDMDGLEEYLYQGQDMNAYVHTEGGMLFELDYLPTSWNYLDTLARRRESYHTPEVEARGYDCLPRKAFVDHFLDESTTIEEFDRATAYERGSFVRELYNRADGKRDTHVVALTASGTVKDGTGERAVDLSKRFKFKRNAVEVDYSITCAAEERLRSTFAPEINLAFLSSEADSLRLLLTAGTGKPTEIGPELQRIPAAGELRFEDRVNDTAITVGMGSECELWLLPVETVSKSSNGLETGYQSTSVVLRYPVDLDPGATFSTSVSLRFEKA